MTHSEIARALRVSRQRVAQIEAVALAKLRRALGSPATGPASLYLVDSEGVPDPAGDGTNEGWSSLRQSRRTDGRFA